MGNDDWNAGGYARNARFVSDLGMPAVGLLAPQAGESVLDLGCGDGALTVKIAGLGPRVVGIDRSESMVAAARELGLDARLEDMHEFALAERFDAVFTNAVLHWTRDIDAVLACTARHLQEGGRFVGEFGGFGNVAAVVVAMRAALEIERADPSPFAWYFPTAAEFERRLAAAGFETVTATLTPRPTPAPAGMTGWLETFATPFIAHLAPEAKQRVLSRAVELLAGSLQDREGNWTIDYVRLRFHAVLRPGPLVP